MPLAEAISCSTNQAKDEELKLGALADISDAAVINRRTFPRLFYLALLFLLLIPYWIGLIKIGSWMLNLFK